MKKYSEEIYVAGELLKQLYEKYNHMESKKVFYKELEGLTIIEINTIIVLGKDNEPKRMSMLAETLGVTNGTPTVTIDRLISKGYVERVRDEADRRQVFVKLSEKGIDSYEAVIKLRRKIIENIFGVLDETEIIKTISILETLNNRLNCIL